MFEIGQDYEIEMCGGTWEGRSVWTVAGAKLPLVRLTSPHDPDWLLNTSSLYFVGAKRIKNEPR